MTVRRVLYLCWFLVLQVSQLSTRIAELEEELSIANQKGHDENDTEQHVSQLSVSF